MNLQELEATIKHLRKIDVSKNSGLYQMIIDYDGIKLHINLEDFLRMFQKYEKTHIESSIFNEMHTMFNGCKIFALLEKENYEINEGLKLYSKNIPLIHRIISAIPWTCVIIGLAISIFCVGYLLIAYLKLNIPHIIAAVGG